MSSASGEDSGSSERDDDSVAPTLLQQYPTSNGATDAPQQPAVKRKRNLPGTPDPDAEVIALSPKTLMTTNRFVCEICNKGFQRDQNLQLHRRGHNLPWKLRQRTSKEIRKRVYICPEPTCVHHEPSRALGDLTGIKKHFCRKHGEKKWKCDKCSKRYAVQSDWKAHLKTCGTREYRCDCGNVFSRRDSFITHRAFCDALAEENARVSAHRQGGSSQQSSQCPESAITVPSGGFSAAPSSPLGASSHELSGGPTDALASAEISKPGRSDGMPHFAVTESGIASLSSKWVPRNTVPNSPSASKGPGLSLWLGTGPGPNPTSLTRMLPNLPSSDSGAFMMSSLRGSTTGAPGTMGSEEHVAMQPHKQPTSMKPFSTGAAGMFANLIAGYSQGSSVGQNGSHGMSGMSSFSGVHMKQLQEPAAIPGNISGSSSFRSRSVPSLSSGLTQQQPSASAQMSATALLQKAAQMGATASTSSVYRGFGLGAGDQSSSIAHGMVREEARHDQGRGGITDILSSSLPAYPSMIRWPGDLPSNSQGGAAGNSVGSSSLPGHGRFNESSSAQEFINSRPGGSGLFGLGGLGSEPSSLRPSNSVKGYVQHTNSLLKHHTPGERVQKFPSNLLHGRNPFPAEPSQAGLGRMQGGEDGGDRPTLDFLGIGGPSGMAGATIGMGRTLSQKDLASITTHNTGMKMEPSFPHQTDSFQPHSSRGHSPGRSWDSS